MQNVRPLTLLEDGQQGIAGLYFRSAGFLLASADEVDLPKPSATLCDVRGRPRSGRGQKRIDYGYCLESHAPHNDGSFSARYMMPNW